jgi:hypothetical protein
MEHTENNSNRATAEEVARAREAARQERNTLNLMLLSEDGPLAFVDDAGTMHIFAQPEVVN